MQTTESNDAARSGVITAAEDQAVVLNQCHSRSTSDSHYLKQSRIMEDAAVGAIAAHEKMYGPTASPLTKQLRKDLEDDIYDEEEDEVGYDNCILIYTTTHP
jgi:hypothetical protein